jgi:hippurate hydrolase
LPLTTVVSPAPDSYQDLYRDLHRHPELSGAEKRTASVFARVLAGTGLAVTTGVGGHGVVGVLDNGPGPVVLLRAELDALPVREETGLPYASTATGTGADGSPVPVMHACGHDLHLAAAAGAAGALARDRASWRGTLMVVGQPAEETLDGAAAMLADGLYRRFRPPDVVLAQHAVPLPAGLVAHSHGPVLAGSATFRVTVTGRGGHVAVPQLCVDPVVVAASIVVQLQTVVSRHVGPAEAAVLNVGRLRAGESSNVIPDTASMDITVRALSEPTLDRMVERVREIVVAQCAAAGCPTDPAIVRLNRSPVTVPQPALTARIRAAHEQRFGPERVTWWPASLATEDVARLATDGVALGYWMLGTVGPRDWAAAPGDAAAKLAALPGNHSARFAPHPGLALPAGIDALVTAARVAFVTETDAEPTAGPRR